MTVIPTNKKELRVLERSPNVSAKDMMTEAEKELDRQNTIRRRAEWYVEEIIERRAKLEKELAEWASKFTSNPHHAMRWSSDIFAKAAAFDVLSRACIWLGRCQEEGNFDAVQWIEAVKAEAIQNVLRESTSISQSTSVATTLGDRAATAAWAKLAKMENLFF